MDQFLAAGFPSTRDEAWKYTSLRRLESRRFSDAPANTAATARSPASGTRILVVDGHMREAPDPECPGLRGVRVRTLAQALADGEQQGALLRIPSGGGTERFAALNAALSPDAIIVDVADGAQPTGALHIVAAGDRRQPA